MENENIDLEHPPIQIIEVATKTLEEKNCPLKEQHDHIDVYILDEQIDADIADEHNDADIQVSDNMLLKKLMIQKFLKIEKRLKWLMRIVMKWFIKSWI